MGRVANILNNCPEANIAAQKADQHNSGLFFDWHLPSYKELEKLFISRNAIGGFNTSSGFDSWYWSSSQKDAGQALFIAFDGMPISTGSKQNHCKVRPVREF